MSEDGAAKRSSPRLTSAYSTPAPVASRETTLGGVQKTKFAPVVAPRRVKKEDSEQNGGEIPAANPQQSQKPLRGASDRGRGRGGKPFGRGGLLGALGSQPTAPVAISGPFSLGPQTSAKARNSAATAMFRAPSTNTGGGGGTGRARGSRAVTPSPSGLGLADDDNLMELERMMQLEALSLGQDHTPVYLGTEADDKAKKQNNSDSLPFAVSDLLESLHGSVGLFQLPPRLPKIKSAAAMDKDQESEQPAPLYPDGVEGLYGKLLVHASGKVSLEVDGIYFTLEAGEDPTDAPHVTSCQSVVAIDPEYEQSFELGQIHRTFVASPPLSQFLQL